MVFNFNININKSTQKNDIQNLDKSKQETNDKIFKKNSVFGLLFPVMNLGCSVTEDIVRFFKK